MCLNIKLTPLSQMCLWIHLKELKSRLIIIGVIVIHGLPVENTRLSCSNYLEKKSEPVANTVAILCKLMQNVT